MNKKQLLFSLILFLYVAFNGSVTLSLYILLIIVISLYTSRANSNLFYIIILIMMYLFWPQGSIFIKSPGFNISNIISFIGLLFVVVEVRQLKLFFNKRWITNSLFLIYFIYGSILYIWVVFGYLFSEKLNFYYLPSELSISKFSQTILPIILIGLICFSIKNTNDLKVIFKTLLNMLLILLFISIFNWVFKLDIMQTNTVEYISNRFTLFNLGGPLESGRLLLTPLLILVSSKLYLRSSKIDIIIIFGILIIILSLSKTTYFSFTVGVLSIMLFASSKLYKKIILGVAIPILVGVITNYFGIIAVFENTDRGSLANLYVRQNIWQAALEIIKEAPFTGSFPGGLFSGLQYVGYDYRMMSVHSFYLQTATEWGVVLGLISVLFIVLTIVLGYRNYIRVKSLRMHDLKYLEILSFGVFAASISFIVHGIVEVIPMYFVFFNFGLVLAISTLINSSISHTKIYGRTDVQE